MTMRKIAVEEAFSIPEVAEALKQVSRAPGESSDLPLMRGIYDTQGGYGTMKFLEGLLDLEDVRIKDMDANGVDMQLLSLTAPGVQMFDADTACELATLANDRLAAVIWRPSRRRRPGARCAKWSVPCAT
jgi:5-carboxyvanillate decarboxylase